LIAAGVLFELGITEKEAWQRVSSARSLGVPDTEEQRRWLGSAFRFVR
jgi:hypothetical protein